MQPTDDQSAYLNGERLVLDCAGAVWWPAERTLIVSDVHLEKGSSYARRGALLPPYDTRTTLKRLALLIAQYSPGRVIALGDTFHDSEAADRLDQEERAQLRGMVQRREWVWIEGNHDPHPPAWLGGIVTGEIAMGGLIFRHEPSKTPQAGEVAGHLHPCASIALRGRSIRRKCFAADETRLVMPAFGAYTGGLDVRDQAISMLFADAFAAYMLGRRRVYAVPGRGRPRIAAA